MAMFGIDGLASGLDTTALINQLMQVEAMPQTRLKQQSSQTQTLVTALQGLNTKIASLAETATKATKPESWSAWKVTSSSDGATATTSSAANAGSVSFRVEQLATAQQSVSAQAYAPGHVIDVGYPPAVTIRGGDGSLVTVEPTSGSLQDIARAIDAATEAGVRATVVRGPDSPDGTPQYRLQFTGTRTGAEHTFEVFVGDEAAVTAGTAVQLDDREVRAASDARLSTSLGDTITSSTNTFTDLMDGVDVTVSAVTAPGDDAVTLTVDRDDDAVAALAKDLVSSLSAVLTDISTRTSVTTKTNPDGTTSVTGGIFSADSTITSIRNGLSSALSYPVDGRSPSSVGIEIDRYGSFSFDEERFAAAMAEDPAGTQAMVSALAQRVADTAETYSDKYDGSLTRKIQNSEQQIKDFGAQIASWDDRLALRRASLQRTYTGLEVALSNLQGQSSWLAGQLAGLQANWQK